jgi:hypothetical protein
MDPRNTSSEFIMRKAFVCQAGLAGNPHLFPELGNDPASKVYFS